MVTTLLTAGGFALDVAGKNLHKKVHFTPKPLVEFSVAKNNSDARKKEIGGGAQWRF